ncbi:glycosyltransferase family 4 protein [Metabacillus halosaccharovorans]|uniref:glycosyltransferase family 4 protein n=1 Tax=Metabacillus halosaccharovorans TaxID=930124 RepID=UPI00203B9BD5|nr:glycosyltransferase family 4 protein [Metabacillus halosaccharovorans]MCM3443777.1 glycosyltransferase family 4 protein [Metabacillus halosaccharovorans]
MKIVYITQHFPPEIGAAQGRAYDMSSNLSNLGHDLHVLTTFPNSKPVKKFFKKEKVNKLTVYRSFRIRDTKTSSIRRLANYLSFMVSSCISGLLVKRPDVIYATSPQLFQGVTGYFLSRVHRAKFVFEIRDLWVDFAELLGQFKNKKLLQLARKLESFLYKKADHIVVVTHGYKQRLIDLGVQEEKITVIPNGVNPNSLPSLKGTSPIKHQYGIEDKFLVLYAGNIGAAQGLTTIISAAEKLKDDPSVVFMFIGEGVEKQKLMESATSLNLSNVLFIDSKRKEELLDYYEAADVGIVSLKKHPLFEITIPSKVFDYMSMSTPILIGVDGEAKEIVEKHDAGFYFEPENADNFVRVLKFVQSRPDKLNDIKRHVKDKLLQSFNREKQAEQLSETLINLTKSAKKKLQKKTTSF